MPTQSRWERAEKELASALRKKHGQRVGDCRNALDANAATCAMAGSDAAAFRTLCAAWREVVEKKARERNWVRPADWLKIGYLAQAMFRRVAEHSLAHYLDDVCKVCSGTGAASTNPVRCKCNACSETRRAPISRSIDLGISDYEARLSSTRQEGLANVANRFQSLSNSIAYRYTHRRIVV